MFVMTTFAQGRISYSGFVANQDGNAVTNENIDIDISILRDGTSFFSDTYSVQTTESGMVNFMFAEDVLIDWSYGDLFETEVSINLTDGTITGTASIGDVPIAQFARLAQHAITAETATTAETANSVKVGNVDGLTSLLEDFITEADLPDQTQDLEINGHILTITLNDQATEIDLSPYMDDTQLSAEDIDAFGFQRIVNAFNGNYDSLNDPPNIGDSIQNAFIETDVLVHVGEETDQSISAIYVDDGKLKVTEAETTHEISLTEIQRTDAQLDSKMEALGYVKLSAVMELINAQNIIIGDLTGDLAVMQGTLTANDSLQKQNQRIMEDLMAFHNYQPPTGDNPNDPGSVTFMYNGEEVTYQTIVLTNGSIWLNRNLGAQQVATSSTDVLAYGDYFQWGRKDDGHQVKTSPTTTVLAPDREHPDHGNFITTRGRYDWNLDSTWAYRWDIPNYTVDNNVCPDGWHVATRGDWIGVLRAIPQNNDQQLFLALKLTMAGKRRSKDANMQWVGTYGFYFSSTYKNSYHVRGIMFNTQSAYEASQDKAVGLPIRCVKDPLPVE